MIAANIGRSELCCKLEAGVGHDLLEAMEVTSVKAGATIMQQGDQSDTYLILAAGDAVVTHTRDGEETRILATLTEPTGLGEEALLGVESRAVSVTMESDGTLLRIRRDAFAAFVGERAVEWIECDKASAAGSNVCWLWFGAEGRKRVARAGAIGLLLSQLRERISDLDRGRRYYCCCKDGKESAIAAFVLRHRGLEAYAVRDGRSAIARDSA